MKITCDFCKTEYNLDKIPGTSVKCAVCGHTWVPYRPFYQHTMMKFIAAVCALIAACIFSFVVIVNFQSGSQKHNLTASINEKSIHVVKDADGVEKLFVSGNITNNTGELYGLPHIRIIVYDENNNALSNPTFMPPATFLEPKHTITFNHLLSVNPKNVKRVSVELKDSK